MIVDSHDPATWAEFIAGLEGERQGQHFTIIPSPAIAEGINSWRAAGQPPIEQVERRVFFHLTNTTRHPRSRFHVHEIEETVLDIATIAKITVMICPRAGPPVEVSLHDFAGPMEVVGFPPLAITRVGTEVMQQDRYIDYARRTMNLPAGTAPETRRYLDLLPLPPRSEGQWDEVLRERAPDIRGVVFSVQSIVVPTGEPAIYFTPLG